MVKWGGSGRATTLVSAIQLTASISADDIATAGTGSITVFNPTPGGGTSNVINFKINNPVPTINRLSPDSKTAGQGDFTLLVIGTGFNANSVVKLNASGRATTFVSTILLTASIRAADIATAGTRSITVFNPTPGGGTSPAATLTVGYQPPHVAGISPVKGNRGQALTGVKITGTDFKGPAANVTAQLKNGADTITGTVTSVVSTQVTADFAIPAGAVVGDWDVYVKHNDDNMSDALARAFAVEYPPPTIAGISPDKGVQSQKLTGVAISGSDFQASGTTVVELKNGSDTITGAVTNVSSTRVTADFTIPAGAKVGAWDVCVTNPDGKSATRTKAFNVTMYTLSTSTWYLAEGSTAWGFDSYITIENPNNSTLRAKITYQTAGGAVGGGTPTLPPMSQTRINPRDTLGETDFSTKVQCTNPTRAIAVDRTMIWTGPGAPSEEGHSSVGVNSSATAWYLPEGSSNWGFESWLLIQNPGAGTAHCKVTYMTEDGGPQVANHDVPAHSRASFSMSDDIGARDASIKVETDTGVIAERSMYRNDRREGQASIGTQSPGRDYYLAEGTSAWGFTTYVLVQNPQPTPTDITVTYMTPSGPQQPVPKYTLRANSRMTIRVNDVLPGTDFSTHVHGTQPIVAERSAYWGADSPLGEACHDSIGMDRAHGTFYMPDGQTSDGRETWTLVQNPNASDVQVEISYLPSGGGTPVKFTETVPANSRKSYNMSDKIPDGAAAIVVTCKTSGKKIMCERSMYWNSRGAGTCTIGGYTD